MTRLSQRCSGAGGAVPALHAMLGAGVFLGLAPGAAAAGRWLPVGIVLAAAVALCVARTTGEQASAFPGPGPVYTSTRVRVGGRASWISVTAFGVAEIAAMGAVGGTVGAHLAPGMPHRVAAVSVLLVVLAATMGAPLRGALSIAGLSLALTVLAVLVVVCLAIPPPGGPGSASDGAGGPGGILTAAGVAFFGFRGLEHLTAPGRSRAPTVRWRTVALLVVVGASLQLLVAAAVVHQLGPARLALSPAPVLDALSAADAGALRKAIGLGTGIALLPVLLGVVFSLRSTGQAMVREAALPGGLGATGRSGNPYRLEIAAGVVAAVLAALVEPVTLIQVAACCALVHYAFTAIAARLMFSERVTWPMRVACLGLAASVVLLMSLPLTALLTALGTVLVGALLGTWQSRAGADRPR